MGSAFGRIVRALFDSWGLLLVDPMDRAVREITAPLMREAVERMPELVDALIVKSRELVDRGYHAQGTDRPEDIARVSPRRRRTTGA